MRSPLIITSKAVTQKLKLKAAQLLDAPEDREETDFWRVDTINLWRSEKLFIFTHQRSLFSIIISQREMRSEDELLAVFRQRLQSVINNVNPQSRLLIGEVNLCKKPSASLIASMNNLRQMVKRYRECDMPIEKINDIPLKHLGFSTPQKSFLKLL